MFYKLFIILLFVTLVHAQINGDFLWLNRKLNMYRNIQPPEPKAEIISEYDMPDHFKSIVFKEHYVKDTTNDFNEMHKVSWPNKKVQINLKLKPPGLNGDQFNFVTRHYDKYRMTTIVPDLIKSNMHRGKYGEFVVDDVDLNRENVSVRPVCTYMTRNNCIQNSGLLYDYNKNRKTNIKEKDPLICCVLPLPVAIESRRYDPVFNSERINSTLWLNEEEDDPWGAFSNTSLIMEKRLNTRIKKSIPTGALTLEKRHIFVRDRLKNKPKMSAPANKGKIVTQSESSEEDVYWNIKNPSLQKSATKSAQSTKYNHDITAEYPDYEIELPKPGLVGLYSSQGKPTTRSPGTTKYQGTFKSSDEYNDYVEETMGSSGYAIIDPRKVTRSQKYKAKGFKLVVSKNKSSVVNKVEKTTTTESDSQEVSISVPSGSSEEDYPNNSDKTQLYGKCGNSLSVRTQIDGLPIGLATNGSHPSIAFVVLTEKKQNVMCYATLIHPRVAISVAERVYGTAPNSISVLAGLFNLNDKTEITSRIATVFVHPDYVVGKGDNNLALLHWMQPFKLSTNLQPACLGDHYSKNHCYFYGWGSLGLGTNIKSRSKFQKAIIRACNITLMNKLGVQKSEAFCASTQGGPVTGLGGPLICNRDGRSSIVGVKLTKNQRHLLIPVREFALEAALLIASD